MYTIYLIQNSKIKYRRRFKNTTLFSIWSGESAAILDLPMLVLGYVQAFQGIDRRPITDIILCHITFCYKCVFFFFFVYLI